MTRKLMSKVWAQWMKGVQRLEETETVAAAIAYRVTVPRSQCSVCTGTAKSRDGLAVPSCPVSTRSRRPLAQTSRRTSRGPLLLRRRVKCALTKCGFAALTLTTISPFSSPTRNNPDISIRSDTVDSAWNKTKRRCSPSSDAHCIVLRR
jgi:hypothetical protein